MAVERTFIIYKHRACTNPAIRKITYSTEIAARSQAFRYNVDSARHGRRYRRQAPYQCEYCQKWHLTTRTLPWV